MVELSDLLALEKKSEKDIYDVLYCDKIIAERSVIEETGCRTVRILRDKGRYFWHEMHKGEFVKCFEVLLHWQPFGKTVNVFAFTPDDLHIYEFDTRKNKDARVDGISLVTAKRLYLSQIFPGMSCSVDDVKIVFEDENHISVNSKPVKVVKDNAYIFKLQKTQIKANDGARGLFRYLENIAENKKLNGYEVFEDTFQKLYKYYTLNEK